MVRARSRRALCSPGTFQMGEGRGGVRPPPAAAGGRDLEVRAAKERWWGANNRGLHTKGRERQQATRSINVARTQRDQATGHESDLRAATQPASDALGAANGTVQSIEHKVNSTMALIDRAAGSDVPALRDLAVTTQDSATIGRWRTTGGDGHHHRRQVGLAIELGSLVCAEHTTDYERNNSDHSWKNARSAEMSSASAGISSSVKRSSICIMSASTA